jgi:hypothetical protein
MERDSKVKLVAGRQGKQPKTNSEIRTDTMSRHTRLNAPERISGAPMGLFRV